MAAEAAMDGIAMMAAAKADGTELPEEENLMEGNMREGNLRGGDLKEEDLREEDLTEGRMNAVVKKTDILTIIAAVKTMKGNVKERVVRFQE